MGGNFNAHIVVLPDTIDINDLCELLHVLELAKTKQLSVVDKQQNHNISAGGWGRELLDLCYDVGLLILNGQTPCDKSKEFTYLVNGGWSTIDYIIGSFVIWYTTTHLEVIIHDTCSCAMGGDSDHKLLCRWLKIDYNFVEPQHTVVTKKFFHRFKYDKSKVEKYQLALTTSLGNLLVVD